VAGRRAPAVSSPRFAFRAGIAAHAGRDCGEAAIKCGKPVAAAAASGRRVGAAV